MGIGYHCIRMFLEGVFTTSIPDIGLAVALHSHCVDGHYLSVWDRAGKPHDEVYDSYNWVVIHDFEHLADIANSFDERGVGEEVEDGLVGKVDDSGTFGCYSWVYFHFVDGHVLCFFLEFPVVAVF